MSVEEIENIMKIKQEKSYKSEEIKSFRVFIRRHTDYAPSTVYTYIKLYAHFGKELNTLGLTRARLLLKHGRLSKQDVEMAKKLSVSALKRFLNVGQ
ncbi:MAG: hypothetical protein QW212_00225 [Nitrososphaerales archaeon]